MRLLLTASLGVIANVFAGYPAAIALLARLRPRPLRGEPDFTPAISLVILAHNEADVIEEKLRNVRELDYPQERLEVLVVTDGSSDDTPERARSFPGVRVLHEPERRGKLVAMNRGLQVASNDILVFSDANNLYTRDALRELVAVFADPSVGAATGRKSIDDGSGRALDRAEGIYWRYESKIKQWESLAGSVVGVCGEILAFRREAYQPPVEGAVSEDFQQALLVAMDGWRVVYAPRAISLERASATIEDEATRRSRLTAGRGQALRRLLPRLLRERPFLAWQVISHKGLRPAVPWALLLALFSNLRLARLSLRLRLMASGQLVFYLAAALGWEQERRGRRNRLTYLPFYFCRMNIATIRGLRDWLTGRQDAVWARVRRG
jgi:biofilm PGA synthesis N-glycosyltransferase PgaC